MAVKEDSQNTCFQFCTDANRPQMSTCFDFDTRKKNVGQALQLTQEYELMSTEGNSMAGRSRPRSRSIHIPTLLRMSEFPQSLHLPGHRTASPCPEFDRTRNDHCLGPTSKTLNRTHEPTNARPARTTHRT
jgi:hypothetical protein